MKKTGNKQSLQRGTGVHLDSNPYNLWKKETDKNGKLSEPLDRFRLYQTQIPLNDQKLGDSGLEIIPGFAQWCEEYYKKHSKGRHGFYSSYNVKLTEEFDGDILNPQEIKRIPKNWKLSDSPAKYSFDEKKDLKFEDIVKNMQNLSKEHELLKSDLYEEGDFIIWDFRAAHCNGIENKTDSIRKTMYIGYLTADVFTTDRKHMNIPIIEDQITCRKTGEHPSDFPVKWKSIEKNNYEPFELSELGKKLYGYEKWENKENEKLTKSFKNLTQTHIDFYKRYGYVVIENVVSKEATQKVKSETDSFILKHCSIDMNKYQDKLTFSKWNKVSGTFGGMIELYWLNSMEEIRQNEDLYSIVVQLMKETWESGETNGFRHPFGKIESHKLWTYVDRQNYRFPTEFIEKF
eukprot:gene10016-2335_t